MEPEFRLHNKGPISEYLNEASKLDHCQISKKKFLFFFKKKERERERRNSKTFFSIY